MNADPVSFTATIKSDCSNDLIDIIAPNSITQFDIEGEGTSTLSVPFTLL